MKLGKKWLWGAALALPLSIGGALALTSNTAAAQGDAYVCPINGESLPCPDCCPLNEKR